MSKRILVASAALLGASTSFAQLSADPAASLEGLTPQQRFLKQNCIECHNSTDQSAAALYAGLFFDKVDVTRHRGGPGDVGESRPQARHRHDAAGGQAPSRRDREGAASWATSKRSSTSSRQATRTRAVIR